MQKWFEMSERKQLTAGPLSIGWGMEDITPRGPVSLYGQYYERMSQYVQSPLKITACALESRDESGKKEQAIMVSMDLIYTLRNVQDALKEIIKDRLPDFDSRKLFLNATHTHSAPYPELNSEFGKTLLEKLVKVVVSAWESRKPAAISQAFGYAVVGHNRRACYNDGTAEMYGNTDRSDFVGMEGPADPGVDMIFCWDEKKDITGIILNVSCPAQVTESKYYVSADFWSEVRERLQEKFSPDIYILPQCGAAGDLSPRDLPAGYKTGEPNMWEVDGMIEIGKRLARVVDQAYPEARKAIRAEVIFHHSVKDLLLPTRRVNEKEYKKAAEMVREIRSREPEDPHSPQTAWNRFLSEIKNKEKSSAFGPWDDKTSDYGWLRPQEIIMQQYKEQETRTHYPVELHVMRLGDAAFATNPFELFVDYGFAITGRSKAKQTFIIQFSGDSGGYLPTQRALDGGGYSAMANEIGPPGGKLLVDETVDLINSLWA
jgi:hypothetical protein